MPGEISATTSHITTTSRINSEGEAARLVADLRLRFHARLPKRHRRLALRRVMLPSKEGPHCVLLEQLCLVPSGRGQPAEWWLVAWHVDRVDVDFRQYSSRAELRKAARDYPSLVTASQQRRHR